MFSSKKISLYINSPKLHSDFKSQAAGFRVPMRELLELWLWHLLAITSILRADGKELTMDRLRALLTVIEETVRGHQAVAAAGEGSSNSPSERRYN